MVLMNGTQSQGISAFRNLPIWKLASTILAGAHSKGAGSWQIIAPTAAFVSSKPTRATSADSASSKAWCQTSVQSSLDAAPAACTLPLLSSKIGRGAKLPPARTSAACGRACSTKTHLSMSPGVSAMAHK